MTNPIEQEIRRERPGMPVLLADLRNRLPKITKDKFDRDILTLSNSGQYFLTRHFYPGSTTEQEKASYIPDGNGNFYIAINPR